MMATRGTCFNPCSGGSIALGIPHRDKQHKHNLVSILVLVEVLPWEFEGQENWVEHAYVSILVLVEVLPWA